MRLLYLFGVVCGAFDTPDSLRRLLSSGEYEPKVPFQQSVHTTIQALKRYKPMNPADEIERLVLEVNGEMEKFQRLSPLFPLININLSQFSNHERILASGKLTQEFHARYMALEQEREQKQPGDEARLKPLIEAFLHDLRAHVTEMSGVIPRMARESGAVTIPSGLPHGGIHHKAAALQDRSQGTGSGAPCAAPRIGVAPTGVKPHAPPPQTGVTGGVMEEIRVEMERFDTIKPLFGRVSVKSDQVSSHDAEILSGRASNQLHERFLLLQRSNDMGQMQSFVQELRTHVDEATILLSKTANANVDEATIHASPHSDLNALFIDIQGAMRRFEHIAPKFQLLPDPATWRDVTAHESAVLRGEVSHALHQRFLALQKQADAAETSPSFLRLVAKFRDDLNDHVGEASVLLERFIRPTLGGARCGFVGPPIDVSAGKLSHTPQTSQTAGKLSHAPQTSQTAGDETQELFQRIRVQMSAFEQIAPLFQRVPSAQVLTTLEFSADELEILTGKPSQLLHKRFLDIQKAQLSPEMIPVIRQYTVDLESHVSSATRVLARATTLNIGGIPGGPAGVSIPGGPGAQTGIPGRPAGVESGAQISGRPAGGAPGGQISGIPGRPAGVASGGQISGIPGRPAGVALGGQTGIPGGPAGVASAGQISGIPGRPAGVASGGQTGIPGGPAGVASGGQISGIPGRPAGVASGGQTGIPGRPEVTQDAVSASIPGYQHAIGSDTAPGGHRTGSLPGETIGSKSSAPQTANIGGIAGGSPPLSDGARALDSSFEQIMQLMQAFEGIKPKFARLPNPQLLRPHVPAGDFHLLSGQASEALHHRFLALQKRVQAATAQEQQSLAQDAEIFTNELRDHVKQMEHVLDVDYSSVVAAPTKAESGNWTREQVLNDLPQVEKELKSTRKRWRKVLSSNEKLMLSEPTRSPVEVKQETTRLKHMMGSLYSSIVSSIDTLRKELLEGEMTDKLQEQLEAILLDIRRYKDTVRDVEGENVKSGGASPALEMLKPQGILTRKPVDLSHAKVPTEKKTSITFSERGG